MSYILKNLCAIIRGNSVCMWKFLLSRCNYSNPIRMFSGAEINISKGGKLELGRGVAIGKRSVCTVRNGALLKMGSMSNLNSDCKIVCHKRIEIGENTIFGPNVLVYDHDHLFDSVSGVHRKEYIQSEIIIGRNCWIGANTVILRGSHIGDNCLIGAGSIIRGNYEDGSIIIQKRETEIKQKLPKSKLEG